MFKEKKPGFTLDFCVYEFRQNCKKTIAKIKIK